MLATPKLAEMVQLGAAVSVMLLITSAKRSAICLAVSFGWYRAAIQQILRRLPALINFLFLVRPSTPARWLVTLDHPRVAVTIVNLLKPVDIKSNNT